MRLPIRSMLLSRIAMPASGPTAECRMSVAAPGNKAIYVRTKSVRHLVTFCGVIFIISEPIELSGEVALPQLSHHLGMRVRMALSRGFGVTSPQVG